MDWTGTPAYKQVAEHLRRRIRDNNLQPGDPLPSLSDLMAEHHVSITVARMALRLLKAEGLVVIAPGKGNFVAGNPADAAAHTDGFDQVMQQLGVMQECIEQLAGRLAVVEHRVAAQPDPAADPTPPPRRRGRQ
jgi:DNA-binding GntR family transcriptional regulator